jgi:PfaD family protein
MANGISSCDMVEAMSMNGMLGFFGAAGLSVKSVESAIDLLSNRLPDSPYGFNLIHSPNDAGLENALVDLYLRRGVNLVEASAYLDLTLPLVRYRLHGIHSDNAGNIVTPNRVIAKVSRVEVATKFFSPPPERLLSALVSEGAVTHDQARMAAHIPMAQDLTAEADSGGHTDNRPAISLIPTMIALRDRLQDQYGFDQSLRVGAAGGISTPSASAAAFAMGAAYVMTGSVNQACTESGTSDEVREMLAHARQADVAMAPAADMFEMGVTVQVLKRGTMFAMRAAKLYEIYRAYDGIEEMPPDVRTMLEKNIFRDTLDSIWKQTCDYFSQCDATQLERARKDPKHLMALVFRWYLGQASRWANQGIKDRRVDYQVWCGPAMGAFNEWAQGSFLEHSRNRDVVTVAFNLLYGAVVNMRINNLRSQGIPLPLDSLRTAPLEFTRIKNYFK